VLNNPLKYFQPIDEIIRKEAEAVSTGTGFIITSDGYLVTNAHVVSAEGDDLKQDLAASALKDVAIESCERGWGQLSQAELQAAIRQTIGTKEFMQMCLQAHLQYFAEYMDLSKIDTEIYTAIGAVAAKTDLTEEGYRSEVKAIGSSIPGKDVAVLKINAENLPTIELGDDQSLEAGDGIFVLGYPAGAVINDKEAAEPSLTSGLVSARKTMPDDWEVIQTDAAMSQGNSGGPVFNDRGEAIGAATFGAVNRQTGEAVQGVNFVVPTTVVREFLQKINVQPQESKLSQQYQEGIMHFEAEQYGQALQLFRQIQELNPQFPYVQEYVTKARSAIDSGKDKTIPVWIYAAAGGGFLLVSVASGLWLFWRRGKRSAGVVPVQQAVPVGNSADKGQ
jgi:tetratricopeptide (TPR) repeat protein